MSTTIIPNEGEEDELLKGGSQQQEQLKQLATETPPAPSEPSSTTSAGMLSSQPASTVAKEKDGSVISAVTDPASVEGPLLPAMEEEEEANSLQEDTIADVPEHVILDERPESPNAAATEKPSDTEAEEKVGENTTPTKGERERELEKEHDFSQSPAVPSEIVERSPGGRYVRFLEKLGSGASKDVYKAYDTEEGIEVAWNVVSLAGVPKTERNRLVNEVRLLERLDHRNIISFHGSWVNREKQEVIFVTEILSSGTLKKFINKVQVIRWKIAKRWAVQILKGLEYLHSQDPPVIHRDLKCENIFINGPSGDLRIGDLGLSTVHQNGKMLSVLGTPEFMAPDMYEDRPYDESVDVYAFGMCLLEIFTQEIPYSECNNPAQIYKKVINGEPPEVLNRLQSKHARDFVRLCLGYKDEDGNYIRPSVSELLKDPFLQKRDSDDDQVVVERPLRERTIVEEPAGATPKQNRKVKQDAVGSKSGDVHSGEIPRKLVPSTVSDDDQGDEADRFEEMPQSETNIRKVKVMMGRDEELKEDETEEENQMHARSAEVVSSSDATETQPESSSPASAAAGPLTYLQSAAIIENENSNVLAFADGILKLTLTLLVKGESMNVQFDFHLVDDNPFQVAKEMVEELKIPDSAIIEISQMISGLAQQARIQLRAQQGGAAPAGNTQHYQGLPHEQSQMHHSQQNQGAHFVHGQVGTASNGAIHQEPQQQHHLQPVLQHGIPPNEIGSHEQNQTFQQQSASQIQRPGLYAVPSSGSVSNHSAQLPVSMLSQNHQIGGQSSTFHVQGDSHIYHTPNNSNDQVPQAPTYAPQNGGASGFPPRGTSIGSDPQRQLSGGTVSPPSSYGQPNIGKNARPHSSGAPLPHGQVRSVNSASPTQGFPQPAIPNRDVRQTVEGQNTAPQQAHRVHQGIHAPSNGSLPPPAPNRADVGVRTSEANMSVAASDLPPASPKTAHPNGSATSAFGHVRGLSSSESSADNDEEEQESDEEDDDVKEELRKLEEDYQKNLQRAKKVFDNRMDNLQRSQVEKEAQHQKTLEKHQKERAEYEKRLAEEEKQQNRRIEQMKKELETKRQTVAKQKKKQRNGVHGSVGDFAQESISFPQEPDLSHVRSLSSSSTNPSSSPPANAHKMPPESNAGGGPPAAER